MSRGFEAIKTVVVDAPRAKVWDALTNPEKVAQYMHGTHMSTDWKVGSAIIWQGEWKGQSYVDKGTVLAFEPERLLKTTHWSPMGGSEDAPENYHTVTYELAEDGGRTRLTLTQDNNATQEEADKMAENNWGPGAAESEGDGRAVGFSTRAPSSSFVIENGTRLNLPTSVAPG